MAGRERKECDHGRSSRSHRRKTEGNLLNFDSYDLDASIYDEMLRADGSPHPHSRNLCDTLGRLSPSDLGAIGEWVTRSFTNEGVTFTVYGPAPSRAHPPARRHRMVRQGRSEHSAPGDTQRLPPAPRPRDQDLLRLPRHGPWSGERRPMTRPTDRSGGQARYRIAVRIQRPGPSMHHVPVPPTPRIPPPEAARLLCRDNTSGEVHNRNRPVRQHQARADPPPGAR